MKILSGIAAKLSKPVRAGIFVDDSSQNGTSSVRTCIIRMAEKQATAKYTKYANGIFSFAWFEVKNFTTRICRPDGADMALNSYSTMMPRLRRYSVLLLGFFILHSPFCLRSSAQSFSVDWFKVAGGGGTSTGGVFTVSGTFGQADAGGPMNGPGYSATGGFWSLYAQQTSPLTGATPAIISQSLSQFVTNGSSLALNVSAVGTPPLFYQWQKNGVNLTDSGNISGSTTSNLLFSLIATNDGGSYTLIIQNAYGSVTSSVVKLTIMLPTNVTNYTFATLTFDAFPTANANYPSLGSYGGFSWGEFYALDGINYNVLSGYRAGVVSSNNVIFNNSGLIANIMRAQPFNFVSAYLTAAWNDNLQVQVQGYIGSTVIYNNTYTLSATYPTIITFNYVGVNKVTFSSFGGTPHTAYGIYGANHFAMDDVSVAIPTTNVPANFPPKIQTAPLTGGSFKFSWDTVIGFPPVSYQVQYRTNLLTGNWLNLGSAQTTASFTNTISADSQRFYRVLLVQ